MSNGDPGGVGPGQPPGGALDILQRITRPRPRPRRCACRPCSLVFMNRGDDIGRYRVVPERYRAIPDLVVSSGQWDQLDIPVSVAFFFYNSQIQRIAAFYPGPAGATESLLPLEMWEELVAANPILATLQPDVEALIARTDRNEYFLVPIDACYELVGHLRKRWKGFDGGQEARAELEAFFDRLKARSFPVDPSQVDG